MYECFNDYIDHVDKCDITDCVTKSSTVECDKSGKLNSSVNVINASVGDDFGNGLINYMNDECSNKSNHSNKTIVNSAMQKRIVDYTDYVQLKDGAISHDVLSKGIKFGHINMWSLIGKIDVFRHMCNNVFDIICVNETLCDSSISDSELHLPGYNILRKDRNRGGGGVV